MGRKGATSISYKLSHRIGTERKSAFIKRRPEKKIPKNHVDKIATKTVSYHNIFTRMVLGTPQAFIQT